LHQVGFSFPSTDRLLTWRVDRFATVRRQPIFTPVRETGQRREVTRRRRGSAAQPLFLFDCEAANAV
jgi:hypothetical protein